MVRKTLFWLGWGVLFVLPIIFTVQILVLQDLPKVEVWKWIIPFAAVGLIYFSRNRDDVLKHHLGAGPRR